MLFNLMGFNYDDDRSREIWSFSNSTDHDDVRQAIFLQKGVNIEQVVLYPIDWQDWDAYAARHQRVHNQINAALGVSGNDLTRVDFKDREGLEEWNMSHFNEHQSWRAVLKI